ncbi:MAG: AmiR/NasT family two-component response regulator [Oleiphilaceae bacterium]|jgi:AmiR/NasT family two-component response regulator
MSKRLTAAHQPIELSTLVRNLRNHKILLLMPDGDNRAKIEQQVSRIGCQLKVQWPPPVHIESRYQVVMLGLTPVMENKQTFNWDTLNPPAALVLLVDYENPLVLQYALNLNPQAIIGMPFHPQGLLSNLLLSLQEYKQARSMLKSIRNLESKLLASEAIETAKNHISVTQGINLDEAYVVLRQLAMKHRKPVGEMSKDIIAEGITLSINSQENKPPRA